MNEWFIFDDADGNYQICDHFYYGQKRNLMPRLFDEPHGFPLKEWLLHSFVSRIFVLNFMFQTHSHSVTLSCCNPSKNSQCTDQHLTVPPFLDTYLCRPFLCICYQFCRLWPAWRDSSPIHGRQLCTRTRYRRCRRCCVKGRSHYIPRSRWKPAEMGGL